jgi:uncharacterized RDD family membrane protein YckC
VSAAPSPPTQGEGPELEYVGFWLRVLASLIDTIWVVILLIPMGVILTHMGLGSLEDAMQPAGLRAFTFDARGLLPDLLIAVAIVAFWRYRLATPGKMAINARIVDASTGAAPSLGQLVIRYIGYFVSTIPLCLGLIWVGLDPRKQGWHDKIAGTVVVRPRR